MTRIWKIGDEAINELVEVENPRARRVPVLPLGEQVWQLLGVSAEDGEGIPITPHGRQDNEPYWLSTVKPDDWEECEDDLYRPGGSGV